MSISTLEAENAVIGSIIIEPECLPQISPILTADDFSVEANKKIYKAVLELSREGNAIDPVIIRGKADVSSQYIIDLMEITPTAANVEVYARETRKASMCRALNNLAYSIEEQSAEREEPCNIIGTARSELERIEERESAADVANTEKALESLYEHIGIVENGGGFVPTGFRRLDELLGGGLLNSGLYVLAARPGVGKTTFALDIADKIAESGNVLFVSLEMDLNQLTAKRMSRISRVPASRILMQKLTQAEREQIAGACSELCSHKLSVNLKPSATVDDIANMARRIKGLRCIVVDYFGLIRPLNLRSSRYEAMTDISGALKTPSRSLKVPVLVLAQLNRENMKRVDKRPNLSDLRDTGALEQDADGVIFLHRPDYYESKEEETQTDVTRPVLLQIILEKNRHSATGVCEAAFYLATGVIAPAQRG